MIRNLKIDSKSEFGGPEMAEERSAKGVCSTKGKAMEATCGPHVPHGQGRSLPTWCICTPHMEVTWLILIGYFLSLSLSFKNIFRPSEHNLKKIEKKDRV